MRCAVALSTKREGEAALREVVDRLSEGFAGEQADLALVFASIHHADVLGRLGAELTARGLGRHVFGCTGETIIGEDREVEGDPALSAWAIRLPGAELKPIRVDSGDDGLDTLRGFTNGPDSILLLGDPFSFAPDPWLQKLGAVAPGLRVMGGMASASHVPRENRLLLDGQVFEEGAVGMVLGGEVSIRTLVSQGCRPIGRPMIVTKVDRNLIRELGRRPCLEVLREIFEELTEDDQERVQSGLHIGRVINEYQDSFRRGDFLVRNVMGADDAGGIAVTDLLRVGQTVQFHVRDAETADEDLRGLVDSERLDHSDAQVAGALLFSCNGRGTRLFSESDHDVGVLRERFGPIPVAGFFAMGEIGPIGGQNFVHGYTASVVLFEDARENADQSGSRHGQ
jgi:small ligand-binding sensory domain FIST